jgi:site-specific DNA recombinase
MIAIYARVSGEDQAARNTVQNQLDYLRERCRLERWEVYQEYTDEGIPGTKPLNERRAGRKLLQDAKAERSETVLVYRVDRLARSLRVLVDTHAPLSAYGVSIKSATEPLDTSSPFGTFLFNLLGSMAELERSTILERMTLGKQRIASAGKWNGGYVPFGYAVEDGHFVPHPKHVKVAQEVFSRIAAGSSIVKECARLSEVMGRKWAASTLSDMLRNRVYIGERAYNTKTGTIIQDAPALVTKEIFDGAARTLKMNLSQRKPGKRVNILRGLLRYASCGRTFISGPINPGDYYYRCSGKSDPTARCKAIFLKAETIEEAAWAHCQEAIEAFPDLEDFVITEENTPRPEVFEAALDEVAAGRERLLAMVRRGTVSLTEVDGQIKACRQEEVAIKRSMAAACAREESRANWLATFQRERASLEELKARMVDADPTTRQEIIRRLLNKATVETRGSGRKKSATVTFSWCYAVDTLEEVGYGATDQP